MSLIYCYGVKCSHCDSLVLDPDKDRSFKQKILYDICPVCGIDGCESKEKSNYMPTINEIIAFCSNTNILSNRPHKTCVLSAFKLNHNFGNFIKSFLVKNIKFSSVEDFINYYKSFCNKHKFNIDN